MQTCLHKRETGSLNSIEVIEEAYLPSSPLDSNGQTNMLLAAVVGLVLATGGVFFAGISGRYSKEQRTNRETNWPIYAGHNPLYLT